jgi:hypothetical protein
VKENGGEGGWLLCIIEIEVKSGEGGTNQNKGLGVSFQPLFPLPTTPVPGAVGDPNGGERIVVVEGNIEVKTL